MRRLSFVLAALLLFVSSTAAIPPQASSDGQPLRDDPNENHVQVLDVDKCGYGCSVRAARGSKDGFDSSWWPCLTDYQIKYGRRPYLKSYVQELVNADFENCLAVNGMDALGTCLNAVTYHEIIPLVSEDRFRVIAERRKRDPRNFSPEIEESQDNSKKLLSEGCAGNSQYWTKEEVEEEVEEEMEEGVDKDLDKEMGREVKEEVGEDVCEETCHQDTRTQHGGTQKLCQCEEASHGASSSHKTCQEAFHEAFHETCEEVDQFN
ncbi:MAG: hypothetical protein M1816_006826 [Peltula sp. TS41687]|nr:MAG: hypothetical protein M1816_006826 [Peltula sp. TS41687]